MDAELRFISALLSANNADQSDFWNKQLPPKLFRVHGQEVIWIYRFKERTGQFPSSDAFELKFPEATLPAVSDPVATCLEPILINNAYTEIKTVLDRTAELFDKKEDPTRIVETFRSLASKVTSHEVAYVDEDLRSPTEAFRRYRDNINQKSGRYIVSPWPTLNKLIAFMKPGELFTLTARTSLGKTWILCHWADFLAKQQVNTFIMSKEMPTAGIADRMTALRFGLDWPAFRAGKLDIVDQVRWKRGMLQARKDPPYTLLVSGEETMEGTGMEHLYAKVLRLKPQVVMVDGAYLMTVATLGKNASPQEQATAVSRASKRLAKVTNTQVFVVNQMNREAEVKIGGKNSTTSIGRGTLSTIYGSDAWAQDSDFLMEVSGERGSDERVLRVLKGRDTNIGDFYINFKLSPQPNFDPKNTLTSAAMGGIKFKVIQ